MIPFRFLHRSGAPGISEAFVILFICALSATASVPGDEHWDNQFGPVGTSDQLYSATVVGGKLYVGGLLTAAGNTKANYIAGYDGTKWFQMNNGVINSPNTTYVFALANDGTNVYAGGWFTNADNSGARNIARWDGSNWSPFPGGNPNSLVETIKIFGTNFFVGGAFTTNGSVRVNGIARWDGATWHSLGTGVSGGTFASAVLAIEYDGTNLFAGGTFNLAGGVNATNIARWDGAAWSDMGNPFTGSVFSLARAGGLLYAGGTFTNANLGITNFAVWNGSSWSGVNANGAVRDLLSDGTNLYAGGDFTIISGVPANRIARWHGGTWSPLGAGVQGFGAGASPGVYRMTLDGSGRLFVVGNFNQVDGIGASHVAGWDGTNWFALGATTSKGMTHFVGQVQGLFSDGTNLYAGGAFTEGGSVILNGIGWWDGTNWNAMGPVVSGQLPSVVARAFAVTTANTYGPGAFYAGGNFTNLGGVPAGRIARWDGNGWSDIGDADSSVRALAWDGTNNLWVGGTFTNIDGFFAPGLAMYEPNITGWGENGIVAGGSRTVNALFYDASTSPVGTLYVGGNFTNIGPVSQELNNIASSDGGGNWSPLGSGMNGTVNAIVVTNGTLYAGGNFTTAGGVTVNRIAKWDGNAWSALGNGVSGTSSSAAVSAIAIIGNNVYVAGNFTNASGVYAAGIAKWDGTNWSALGSGLYFSVFGEAGSGLALATIGNNLFVGGIFTSAGDKPSMFIARWNDQMNFYPPPHPFLTRSTWLTNGNFQFRLAGTSGESYILQGSTNLNTWMPLMTNSTPLYDFTDTNTSGVPVRFYRAVLGP